jgi:2-dehydropantoate 2-reductase
MKIAVLGAGAVGSYLACMMGQRDHEIIVLARGERAAAIREYGITMGRKSGISLHLAPNVAEDAEGLGTPDIAFVCVKAYSIPALATVLADLSRATVPIVFVQNGIPWWYLSDQAGHGKPTLLDPGGKLSDSIEKSLVLGCVTYVNVQNVAPGQAKHVGDDTFILGRADGKTDQALESTIAAMIEAGIQARASEDLRRDIWVKLWGNLAFNPISALTGATMDKIIASPDTRPLVMAMMGEAQALAAKSGIEFPMSIEQRLEIAAQAGAFKTSMLQDVEAGRPMEIDAIIGAVSAYGRLMGVETPSIDIVLGLLRQKAYALQAA